MNKKTVLITGISRGLGKELALHFSKNDWNVCGCYKTNKPDFFAVRHCEDEGRSNPEILSFQADISDPEEAASFINKAQGAFGNIDCVINNASIGKNKIIFKENADNWNDVIQTNLNGTFYVIKETLEIMAKQRYGSIINISSISAYKSYTGAASYSAGKAAVIALTKTAAREAGRFGITVNAVLPGFHATALGNSAGDKYIEEIKQESVLKTTTDIKEFLDFVFMLSQMKTVSGQVFNIDSRII
ncbi:MAG: SDR family oxidoreductase [Endomicrobia bacterium]|nr:SDR family oxidoreductase [Endomicrobiia bacterium]MCL2506118.1 SDR family oxidoreductase [Endomicrobiia bacterium]